MKTAKKTASKGKVRHQALCQSLVNLILNDTPVSGSRSGLFIAIPDGPVQSRFISMEICPELRQRRALVIHVNLRKSRDKNPADVIRKAIAAVLIKHKEALQGLAELPGGIGPSPTQSELEKHIGTKGGETLASVLKVMSSTIRRMIVLVVEDVPHMLTTPDGDNMMFALKAARDQLNTPKQFGFRLVATGDDPDQLTKLVSDQRQAFFCAPMLDLMSLNTGSWSSGKSSAEKQEPAQLKRYMNKDGIDIEIINSYEVELNNGERIRAIVISDSEAKRLYETGKKTYGILEPHELEMIDYPTYVTVTFEYAATGEGSTMGFMVTYADDAESLRKEIRSEWGIYADDANISTGIQLLPEYETFIPEFTQKIMRSILQKKGPANFFYKSMSHFNYS